MIVYLPEEKVQKIVSECKKLVSKCQATIRQVAKVLGLMVSCFSAVEYGPLFYRKLELAKIQALNINCGNYDAVMPVTSDMAQDLSWWIDNLKNQKRHISHGNPDMVITSDASLLGWGASSGQNKIGSRWKQMSSNFILTIWSKVGRSKPPPVLTSGFNRLKPPRSISQKVVNTGQYESEWSIEKSKGRFLVNWDICSGFMFYTIYLLKKE